MKEAVKTNTERRVTLFSEVIIFGMGFESLGQMTWKLLGKVFP